MLDKLRLVHEKQGPFAQLNLLLKGLQTDFTYNASLRDTLSELHTYYQRVVAMGSLRDDDIFSVLILNALSKNFGPLQYSINSLSNSPHFNSEMIANRILDEDAMIQRHVESGQPANPYNIATSQPSAFPALSSRPRASANPENRCRIVVTTSKP
jgi:gag-polypeptide of LTR copia-type